MQLGRIASGILFIALVAICVVWAPAVRLQILPILLLVAAAVATWEVARLLTAAGSAPWGAGLLVFTLLLGGDGWLFGLSHIKLITVVAVMVTLTWAMTRPIPGAMAAAGVTVLASLWIGLGFGTALAVWHWEGSGATLRAGRLLVAFLLATAMFQDVAAMWTGAVLGRHRLAPTLSPKKTVEGSIGGLIGSVVMGLLLWSVLEWAADTWAKPALGDLFTWWDALALGALFGSVGQLGDLAASLLKRGAGAKDSGVTGTDHGGVLDVADSLLFCGPVMLLWAWARGLWMFS